MRHYPYEYTLWYNLAQAMKCDIYLKLWSYAQNCLICTLHPFYCEKKLSIRYGAHKPVRVSCSHCHVVDVMNDITLCSYAGFVLNVCRLNRCGKCTVETPYNTAPYITGSNIARLGHGSQNSWSKMWIPIVKSAPVRVIFTWKSVPKKSIHGSSDIYLGTQWKQ